ncbi:MAG TPA: hypothetical protein VFA05_09850 [Gaiellaceae bacterium]|nr:hypothetical protein [Gaiellaceae bacterium]
MRIRTAVAALGAAALLVAPSAGARTHLVLLGVHGNAARFDSLTGRLPAIAHVFVGFDQGPALQRVVAAMKPVPLLALVPGSYGSPETGTPRSIALGGQDAFLFDVNAAIAAFRGPLFYLRPFPEMNGSWEAECAYNANGTPRDAAHAVRWTRKAFARIAIIARGGTAAHLTAQLHRLGLPGVARDLPVNTPKVRIVWNPQGFGSPDLAGNSAAAYWPGARYVDVVGDDLYDIGFKAEWAAAEAMYRRWPTKPFAFPEWGLWGIDDPSFVRQMHTWVATHARTAFISYYSGRPGSIWDLASKPRSLALYRALIDPLEAPAP